MAKTNHLKIRLDTPTFAGRFDSRRVIIPELTKSSVVSPASSPQLQLITPQPFARPAAPKLQSSRVLHRQVFHQQTAQAFLDEPAGASSESQPKITRLKLALK